MSPASRLALFLFAVYLLTFSGRFHVMDELAVFAAANNLAQHGRADINQLIWTHHWTPNPPGIWGQDGNLYTKKAPGISFLTAPLIWLGHTLPNLNAVHVGLLTNALVTALTAAGLHHWLTDLGYSRRTVTLTTLAYGLGTIAWVYARMFWESSLLALLFLVAVYCAQRLSQPSHVTLSDHRERRVSLWLLLAGTVMALGLTLRFETIPAILLIGIYLLYEMRTTPFHFRLSYLTLYLTPAIFAGLLLLAFNLIRYGSLTETGYTQEILFQAPWIGGYGLLFSPGRGLFIYAPVMWLLFGGLNSARHRLRPAYYWLIVSLCLFYWLFYGSWYAWGGTWGWGPRFLLPILPLLMLFVAETLESRIRSKLGWLLVSGLAGLSLLVNLLGILVDFNEHFLRLGSNDNFVFNWSTFPPVAHWQILQEGQVDLIWLHPTTTGLTIDWPTLLPALMLFIISGLNFLGGKPVILRIVKRTETFPTRTVLSNLNPLEAKPVILNGARRSEESPTQTFLGTTIPNVYSIILILLTIMLTYLTMVGTARLAADNPQTQADLALLADVAEAAETDAGLLITLPPFGDVQEITSLTMAYFDRPIPVWTWIESPPRSIELPERANVWQATAELSDLWLFQRWHIADEPTSLTESYLNQIGFFISEKWYDQSGKLTRYAYGDDVVLVPPTPVNTSFEGGITLRDFAVFGQDDLTVKSSEVVKLRLTWQATTADQLIPELVIAFAQLVGAGQPVAQSDRLLLNLSTPNQSPLLPKRIISQGYGLPLAADTPPGSYPLIVGLYRASDGQRLPRADDSPDDFLYLTNIEVE